MCVEVVVCSRPRCKAFPPPPPDTPQFPAFSFKNDSSMWSVRTPSNDFLKGFKCFVGKQVTFTFYLVESSFFKNT